MGGRSDNALKEHDPLSDSPDSSDSLDSLDSPDFRDFYEIRFLPATHAPVRLAAGATLSEHLDITNSPVLFGCRTGICGTCLSEIVAQANGELPAPSADEQELLEIVAPGNERARLVCQLAICADITLRYLGK